MRGTEQKQKLSWPKSSDYSRACSYLSSGIHGVFFAYRTEGAREFQLLFVRGRRLSTAP
jgi:hypothetical protein